MMNKFQARKFYRKMFANYPDVLTVEDATNLLGFKSQTGVIRRIHQNRIRYLKVGRNFMIPKEYLIDAEYSKLLTEKKARYPDYRKAKEEMQELLRAQKNIELFFDEERKPEQTEHSR